MGTTVSSLGGSGGQGLILLIYTPLAGSAPTVTTGSAVSFTPTNANLFGNITATGGSNATVRGFAISTSSTLITNVSTTSESGSFGTGAFFTSTTTLTADTTYYFRAYATNPNGTGYGAILNFTTGDNTPTRKMRLFEGFKLKIIGSTLKLLQN